jgi:hypothetical protein
MPYTGVRRTGEGRKEGNNKILKIRRKQREYLQKIN